MQSENATTKYKCKKNAKKVNKNAKNANKNATLKKMRTKMQKKCKLHVSFAFLHFLEVVLSLLQIFQKLQKTQVKCKKKSKQNAKKMQTKMRKKCKFWKCACFTKTNFQKLHCFCIFFAFSWAKVFRVAFSGCILFTCFLLFNQVWKSLERASFYHIKYILDLFSIFKS